MDLLGHMHHGTIASYCPEAFQQPFNLAVIVCWLTTTVCQKYSVWLLGQIASNPMAASGTTQLPPMPAVPQQHKTIITQVLNNLKKMP